MTALAETSAVPRNASAGAFAALCGLGVIMIAATAAGPVVKQNFGNEGLIPWIIASGAVTVLAWKVAPQAAQR